MNEISSGLWSVDWTNGKCVLDCAESNGARCGDLAEEKELLLDPKSCWAPGISAYPPNHFWVSCGPISMKLTSKTSPLQGPFKFIGVQK